MAPDSCNDTVVNFRFRFLLLPVAMVLLSGCGDEPVTRYEVPAERHEVADAIGEVRVYRGEVEAGE